MSNDNEHKGKISIKWPITVSAIIMLFEVLVFKQLDFKNLSANEWGDFLAGTFAPFAFLWLIFGYFQTNRSIEIQSNELRHSIKEMKQQNETSKEHEFNISKQVFLETFELTVNLIAAIFAASNLGYGNNKFEAIRDRYIANGRTGNNSHGNAYIYLLDLASLFKDQYIKEDRYKELPEVWRPIFLGYLSSSVGLCKELQIAASKLNQKNQSFDYKDYLQNSCLGEFKTAAEDLYSKLSTT